MINYTAMWFFRLTCASALLIWPWSAHAGQIDLRLKLQAGKKYSLQMISEQLISQTINGNVRYIDKAIGMGFIFEARSVDSAGTISALVIVHSAKFKQESDSQIIEYDSSRNVLSEIPPEAAGVGVLVGEQFTVKLSPHGAVKQIEGIEQMVERIIRKLDIPEESRNMAAHELRGQLSAAVLKEMMESLLAVYPAGPVSLGDSWHRVSTVSEGYTLLMENTWTLKAVRDGRAVITVRSEGKPFTGNAPSDARSSKFSYDLRGTQEGTLELDASSRWIVRGLLTQKIQGRVLVNGTQQLGQPVSWPISVEGTVELKPVEGELE